MIADAGYYSEDNVAKCPARAGISPNKTRHILPLEEHVLAPKPTAIDDNTTNADKMRQCLNTANGRAIYHLRKMTVESGFGIIKSTVGLRDFLRCDSAKVRSEWALVRPGHTLKRLWRLRKAGNGAVRSQTEI